MTPQQFMDVVFGVYQEQGNSLDEQMHPEDLCINLSTIMEGVAAGIQAAGTIMRQQEKNEYFQKVDSDHIVGHVTWEETKEKVNAKLAAETRQKKK
jgi:hypothetical protein